MTVRLNEVVSRRKHFLVVPLVAAASLAVARCGSDEEACRTAAPPASEAKLKGAPAKLAQIHEQQNELLWGGTEAFEARLRELEGYPVVVNKWASWCGPCRAEFRYFQSQAAKQGTKVAFLGVDSDDGEDSACDFLTDNPVPYPSYIDPDLAISDEIGALAWPATAFYDRRGEPAYVKQGPYGGEQELAADIERYAR
jgi:cytochrome c biogenesis protein CcmG, thiol:disulfide interchange protein DsbE